MLQIIHMPEQLNTCDFMTPLLIFAISIDLCHNLPIKSMTVWSMPEIMNQSSQSTRQQRLILNLFVRILLRMTINQMPHIFLCQMGSSYTMLESCMRCSRKYIFEATKLLDVPQSLKHACINEVPNDVVKVNETVDIVPKLTLLVTCFYCLCSCLLGVVCKCHPKF